MEGRYTCTAHAVPREFDNLRILRQHHHFVHAADNPLFLAEHGIDAHIIKKLPIKFCGGDRVKNRVFEKEREAIAANGDDMQFKRDWFDQ